VVAEGGAFRSTLGFDLGPGGRVGPEGREARVELIEEDASFERFRR